MNARIIAASVVFAGGLFVACANGGLATDPAEGADGGSSGSSGTSGGTSGGVDGSLGGHDGGSSVGDGAGADGGSADSAAPVDAAPACVDTDAGCATGSPGLCGPGTLHCNDAGVAVCVSVETTQVCYSGLPATRNIGPCHDGTQTCTGTLGTCVGEVIPAVRESCFDAVDDDCNGVVNNGCPAAITLGGDRLLGIVGGGGGGLHTVHCPTGAFITRVDSWFDDTDAKASGVSIYCATPSLVQGAASYSLVLTPNAPAPYTIFTGSINPRNERSDDCGITGLTAITYSVGRYDNFVEGMGHHCGTGTLTFAADNTLTYKFTTTSSTAYTGYAPFPGAFFSEACNDNEVMVGFNLHTGNYLDSLQPICAALVTTYK